MQEKEPWARFCRIQDRSLRIGNFIDEDRRHHNAVVFDSGGDQGAVHGAKIDMPEARRRLCALDIVVDEFGFAHVGQKFGRNLAVKGKAQGDVLEVFFRQMLISIPSHDGVNRMPNRLFEA